MTCVSPYYKNRADNPATPFWDMIGRRGDFILEQDPGTVLYISLNEEQTVGRVSPAFADALWEHADAGRKFIAHRDAGLTVLARTYPNSTDFWYLLRVEHRVVSPEEIWQFSVERING